jgi:hypothetical protein
MIPSDPISGKKSCPPKLMREESASSDCNEETYLTPNSLKPDLPDETTKIQVEPEDPEIRYFHRHLRI